MGIEKFIEECGEKLHCPYCGDEITGSFSMYGGGITSKKALERHKKDCPSNPNSSEGKLCRDIERCQTKAKIFNCLNCQYYQKRCKGVSN